MTHVSDRQLDPNINKVLDTLLLNSIEGLNDKESPLFVSSVFSETEIEMFKKRLGIILFLELGATNQQIASIIKTTPQTISRIKVQWKATPNKSKSLLLRKLKSTYERKEVKNVLLRILSSTNSNKG